MASRPKRVNAGSRMTDIIENLNNDNTEEEETDEFHDSIQGQASDHESHDETSDGDNEQPPQANKSESEDAELRDLTLPLKKARTARRKAEIRVQIEEERDKLRKITTGNEAAMSRPGTDRQIPPSTSSSTDGIPGPTGEKNNFVLAISDSKPKSLKIVDHVWQDPVPAYETVTMSGNVEFRIGKQ